MLKLILSTTLLYGLAQLIMLLASPIITRLYEPSLYANFGYIISLTGIVLPIVTLRYEYAIPLLKTARSKKLLATACLYICFVMSVPISLFVYYFFLMKEMYLNIFGIFLFSIIIFLTGLLQVKGIFLISKGLINKVAIGKSIQNIFLIVFLILLPVLFGVKNNAVIMFSVIAGLLSNYIFYKNYEVFFSGPVCFKRLADLLKIYYRFPLYTSVGSLLDGISVYIPLFFIGNMYGESLAGVYFLVIRIFCSPSALVGKVISQLLMKEMSCKNRLDFFIKFKKITIILFFISIIYYFFMIIFSANIEEVFGNKWKDAKEVLKIMSPLISLMFFVSPISISLLLLKKNIFSAIWQIIAAISTIILFIIFKKSGTEFLLSLRVLTYTWFFLYLLYFFVIFISVYNVRNCDVRN